MGRRQKCAASAAPAASRQEQSLCYRIGFSFAVKKEKQFQEHLQETGSSAVICPDVLSKHGDSPQPPK